MPPDVRPDDPAAHQAADLAEALVEDVRVAEQGLRVRIDGDLVVVAGCVGSQERRSAIAAVVAERMPDHRLELAVTLIEEMLDEPCPPEAVG